MARESFAEITAGIFAHPGSLQKSPRETLYRNPVTRESLRSPVTAGQELSPRAVRPESSSSSSTLIAPSSTLIALVKNSSNDLTASSLPEYHDLPTSEAEVPTKTVAQVEPIGYLDSFAAAIGLMEPLLQDTNTEDVSSLMMLTDNLVILFMFGTLMGSFTMALRRAQVRNLVNLKPMLDFRLHRWKSWALKQRNRKQKSDVRTVNNIRIPPEFR